MVISCLLALCLCLQYPEGIHVEAWQIHYFNRNCYSCIHVNPAMVGVANIWEGQSPARPILGYANDVLYNIHTTLINLPHEIL